MRIELAIGCPKFAAPDAGVHLDIYTPEATIESITPNVQQGLDVGWIVMKDEPKPIEAPVTEEEIQEPSPEGSEEISEPAVVRPTQKTKCVAKTKAGTRCKKNALKYSTFCISHIGEEDLAEVDKQLATEEG